MAEKKGKFIALYGINGIGKSTQVQKIIKEIVKGGLDVHYLKYPIYDLPPEGPFLNKYLREKNFREDYPRTTHELQKKFMCNRQRYEPTLTNDLNKGIWIVAEDYVGTGIAWGLTWNGSREYLEEINKDLLVPDVEILMDGEQFDTAIEKGHRNEDNKKKIYECREHLLTLAREKEWTIINANQSIHDVTSDIMKVIGKND